MTAFSKIVLPLGFRFAPTDEELVMYLQVKNRGQSSSDHHEIPEIDICKYRPWDVPEIYEANSLIGSKDSRWYFFCPKNYTSPNSSRSKRATEDGSWKSTGQDREIISTSDRAVIAIKKILVFTDKTEKILVSNQRGASSKSVLTNWIIHEYRLPELKGGFVLCCLFKKPEQRTSSNATVQNSILPPAPPSDSDTVGASVEPVAQADQNFAVFDLRENVQPLPQASDMQTSGEKYELLPDEASNNPSNPDVTHVTGSVLSDVAADHELNETTRVNYLKDNPTELAAPEFDGHGLNNILFTDKESEYIDSWLRDPGECLHHASNAFSSSWKPDPEKQGSRRDSFSVKEMQTGVVEEKVATISNSLPQASDMQTSGENYALLPDEASNNPSNPDVTHVTGSVLSDVAADHESNGTPWVNYLKDYLPELVVPEFDDPVLDGFHINSPLLTDTGLASCDPDSVGQKFPPGLYQCHSAEEDIVTEFINSILCDPDECLQDASNPFSSPSKLDPEDQSFVCPDIPHRDSFLVKKIQTGLVEEKDATISNERVEFSGETCKLSICSSRSQQNNYIAPTKRGMNQFSSISDQNLNQDISFVEATTSSSHQVSAEMDNLDSAVIKIRTHKNSSDSDCLMEQQGLARKRISLQKLVHKKSPVRTDHVSNSTNGDVVISVVSEAQEIVELQCGEEKLKDVASHDEPASTGIQYSSSNILRRRAGCASKDEELFKYCELDEVTTPPASHCTSTAIMILSALLFLIFIGLSWRLSS